MIVSYYFSQTVPLMLCHDSHVLMQLFYTGESALGKKIVSFHCTSPCTQNFITKLYDYKVREAVRELVFDLVSLILLSYRLQPSLSSFYFFQNWSCFYLILPTNQSIRTHPYEYRISTEKNIDLSLVFRSCFLLSRSLTDAKQKLIGSNRHFSYSFFQCWRVETCTGIGSHYSLWSKSAVALQWLLAL